MSQVTTMTPAVLKQLVEAKEENQLISLSILNIMKDLNVDRIDCDYRGSNDSPDGCDMTAWKFNGVKTTTDANGNPTSVQDWEEDHEAYQRMEPYAEIINEWVLEVSCDHWGGWYNDDGGYGVGRFQRVQVKEPCFFIDHYAWETNEVHQGDYTYTATEDGTAIYDKGSV